MSALFGIYTTLETPTEHRTDRTTHLQWSGLASGQPVPVRMLQDLGRRRRGGAGRAARATGVERRDGRDGKLLLLSSQLCLQE